MRSSVLERQCITNRMLTLTMNGKSENDEVLQLLLRQFMTGFVNQSYSGLYPGTNLPWGKPTKTFFP